MSDSRDYAERRRAWIQQAGLARSVDIREMFLRAAITYDHLARDAAVFEREHGRSLTEMTESAFTWRCRLKAEEYERLAKKVHSGALRAAYRDLAAEWRARGQQEEAA